MEYTIKKLANMAGISTRTLRYYDEIGLLKPKRISSSGYRIYGARETDLLHQILLLREMELPLEDIRNLIYAPDYDKSKALKDHLIALEAKQQKTMMLIHMVKKTIDMEERKVTMTDQEKFQVFKENMIKENKEKYEAEITEKYGEQQIKESDARIMNLSKEDFDKMEALNARILSELALAVREKADPAGETGQKIAGWHKDWLSYSWSFYNTEAHAGLAQMYVDDPRFTAYYDKEQDGCAVFLRDAILAFIK